MGAGERVGHLARDPHRLPDVQLYLSAEPRSQGLRLEPRTLLIQRGRCNHPKFRQLAGIYARSCHPMPGFDGFRVGLCRPCTHSNVGVCGLGPMSGPRADADLARSNRCRHTLALERFGYWSVKTRAFDGRDVDGIEQPVRRLPCRLGQATVPGPENGRDRFPPRDGPTRREQVRPRFGRQARAH